MGKSIRNDIELYFEWYLSELQQAGYVEFWDRESQVFELFPKFKMNRRKYYKTKLPIDETFNLLGNARYTYDYRIFWSEKAKYVLFNPIDFSDISNIQVMIYPDTFFLAKQITDEVNKTSSWVSYIDIKPPAKAAQYNASMSSYHTFPTKQKVLLWLHKEYINKVIPIPMSGSGATQALFPNTFTPKRYLFTDGGKQARKIKFRKNTMSQYIQHRESLIDRINTELQSVKDKLASQGSLFK